MPLFRIHDGGELSAVKTKDFATEKQLQELIEQNLSTIFNCRLVASEFSTGAAHGGRIDTLALSEDDNPVIIEYKKEESSDLVNQSLFYLSWIQDHHGDFQVAAVAKLGHGIKIDWSDIRVICIAPGYKKYDVHAVQAMGANIELWQYRLFEDGAFYLEEEFQRTPGASAAISTGGKNPVMVAAGKKAAETRKTGSYTFAQHLGGSSELVKNLALSLQEFVLGLDESVEEAPKKLYVAYKLTRNFMCMELQKNKILLFLKIDPSSVDAMPSNAMDMRKTGHCGTGNFALTVQNDEQAEAAKPWIRKAFENVGG